MKFALIEREGSCKHNRFYKNWSNVAASIFVEKGFIKDINLYDEPEILEII